MVSEIRRLAGQVGSWPGATPEAQRLAAVIWDEAGREYPDPAHMSRAVARLTGEMRKARYQRDPDIRLAVNELRRAIAAAEDSSPAWGQTPHQTFAARTRAAARDAGLDLDG